MQPRPSIDLPSQSSPMDDLRALMMMLGSVRWDAAAIATLTGISLVQLSAWQRLGLIIVIDGFIASVRW